MKKCNIYWLINMVLLITSRATYAQKSTQQLISELEIGKPCPEFILNHIDFYDKTQANLKDFRGKWLVLDFWDKDCSSCIASFPKISKEQEVFKNEVQFLFVAPDDRKKENRALFAKYHQRLKLKMPSAFDSTVFKKFVYTGGLPRAVIVDPLGVIRAITPNVSDWQLRDLISGKMPAFDAAAGGVYEKEPGPQEVNSSVPFLINGNGGPDSAFMFRSLLAKWDRKRLKIGRPESIYQVEEVVWTSGSPHQMGSFDLIGVDLNYLYRTAYLGEVSPNFKSSKLYGIYWPNPVIETRDSDLFKSSLLLNKNIFCYSLVVPKEKRNAQYMMGVMQNDLKNYFGFKVAIEDRLMPCWKLIANENAKKHLPSKSKGEMVVKEIKPWQSYQAKNYPIQDFAIEAGYYAGITDSHTPILNDTGITGNIDISYDWVKGSLESVQETLKKNGLELIKSQRIMKVIVIKDPI